jgi:hypothetical protein
MNKTLIAIALSFLLAGCLQGLGERCQVNADCASNLCSGSDPKVCVTSGDNNDQSPIDAEVPIDAPIIDAADAPVAVDAAVDAP